jgi:diketogulonate reductase-like aldo/keto reductase
VSDRTGATVAQVVFRWAIAVGMMPVTGSTDARRMAESLACQQFELRPDEIEAIANVGR